MAIGDPVDNRTAPSPKLSQAEQAERIQRAKALSASIERSCWYEGLIPGSKTGTSRKIVC
jgi:hypothetical protein